MSGRKLVNQPEESIFGILENLGKSYRIRLHPISRIIIFGEVSFTKRKIPRFKWELISEDKLFDNFITSELDKITLYLETCVLLPAPVSLSARTTINSLDIRFTLFDDNDEDSIDLVYVPPDEYYYSCVNSGGGIRAETLVEALNFFTYAK